MSERDRASAYAQPSDWTVLHGDALWWLRELPAASIDAVVTDPPYGIGFMGHEWDRPGGGPQRAAGYVGARTRFAASRSIEAGTYDLAPAALRAFQEWTVGWAAEVLRVLKPGGHLISFASTRTNHRHVCGMEDAGFEIRDSLAWLFGAGFPKSHNLKDEWEGWGSALKPGHEPITLARAPLATRAMRDNVRAHGTGALHVDACRVESGSRATREPASPGAYASVATTTDRGRWPANVLLDQEAAQVLDEQSGILVSGANPTRRGADNFRSVYGDFAGQAECEPTRGADAGGASRFYYCAKASAAERNAGLDGLPVTAVKRTSTPTSTIHNGRSGSRRVDDRQYVPTPRANGHPTVKPIDLMRWLVRLVTPPGGVVLDPFAGSGTTGCAAVLEGFDFVGIEREAEYVALAEMRIAWWESHPQGMALVVALDAARRRLQTAATGQLSIEDALS